MRTRRGHALVTGGAGFIGTNLTARLALSGDEVVVVDDLSRVGVKENVAWLIDTFGDLVHFHQADVCDSHALRPLVAEADRVYHLAAQVAVTASVRDPSRDFQTNLAGTFCMLEELRRLDDPPFLLFTSTNKVYGALPDLELERRGRRWEPVDDVIRSRGLSETRPLEFCSPYGCSKGGADQYVLDYARSFGLPAVVFRMSCIYGPHQHGNEDQGWVAHIASQILQGRRITVFGDGHQVRDILFVDDLVDAMLLASDSASLIAGQAFNIGGGPANAVSLCEVVDALGSIHGVVPVTTFKAERQGDQRYYVADTRRFSRACGWRPLIPASVGIEQLYRWLARRYARTSEAAGAT